MKKAIRIFLKGVLVLAPVGLTFYIIYMLMK
jgi:uncharacterized membrane protein